MKRILLALAAVTLVPACGGGGGGGGGGGAPGSGDLQPGFGDGGSGIIQVNPDPGAYDAFNDGAIDVAGGFMYVVGCAGNGASTNFMWRIEKRLLSDGSYVPGFGAGGIVTVDPDSGTNTLEEAFSIAIDVANNVMYVLGSENNAATGVDWRVEKRFLDTGLPDLTFGTGGTGFETIIPSAGDDLPSALAIDATHMYLVGYDEQFGSVDTQWRIERRSLATGAVDGGFGSSGVRLSNPSSGTDEPEDIAIDGTWMYVVGTSTTGGPDVQWHIEKRDLTTGVGDAGFGSSGVMSINHTAGMAADDTLRSIALDVAGGFMYLAGDDNVNTGYDQRWRVEKRFLTDGSLVAGFNGGVVTIDPGPGFDIGLGVFLDGSALYVGGLHHLDPPIPNQDIQIEIRKLDAATGLPITTFGSAGTAAENPTALVDGMVVFGADATHVYLGGIENVDLINSPPAADQGCRLEKRLK
jgi:hypothetical protein